MKNKLAFILIFLTFSLMFLSRTDISYTLFQTFGIFYAISWVVIMYFYFKSNKKNEQRT